MTGRCIAYRADGWLCDGPGLFPDAQRGGMVCARHLPDAPPELEAFEQAVEDLATVARAHRAMTPHAGPPSECLLCASIERRRRELARQCPE